MCFIPERYQGLDLRANILRIDDPAAVGASRIQGAQDVRHAAAKWCCKPLCLSITRYNPLRDMM